MSNYSNFVGYVPDKLRLETTGGALVEGELGLPNEYIASLSIGPVSTGAYVSNPGIALDAAATFTIESGASYIQFKNLTATKNAIVVTGASEGSGTDFEANFSNLEYVGYQITGRSDRLKKLSLGALKRIDNLENNQRVALYYSGGHNVTGEVYSPNLVQAAGNSGVYLNFGSGGLKGLDNTFSGYVSGVVIISGYADYGSGNHELLPYEDFLSVHQVGGLRFWAGSNWENVALAMNQTGIGVANGNTAVNTPVQGLNWNIYTHQNTTGVVIPRLTNDGVNAYVSTPTTNTGDLTITLSGAPVTKPSGYYNRLDFNQNTDGKNLTVINNSNEYFNVPVYIGNIGAINIKSSGSLTFSGRCLTGVAQYYAFNTTRYSKFQATDDIVVNATTGTYLAAWAYINNGGCVFWAVSESGNVTYEASNLKETNMGWYLQLKGSGTTGLINFPEATGFISTGNPHNTTYQNPYCFISMTPGSADAVDTVQTLNIPKLQQYSGTLNLYGLSGSTSTISGADLTSWSGNHNFYTSGDLYYTFTGGGGDGSGEVIGTLDHRTYLSGNTISGNRGTLKRCNAITYSLSGVDGTGILVADELREIGGNINLRGLSGTTINATGADVDYISGYLIAYTSGNINYTFTGGPGTGSGYMTSYVDNRVYDSGSTITGNLGTLSQNVGVTLSGGNANAVDTDISLTATGLHEIGSNIKLYGVSGSTITYSGADLSYVSGSLLAISSGNVYFTCTGGPGAGSGYITSNVWITGYLPSTTISGNLGSVAAVNNLNMRHVSGGTVSLTATGLESITGTLALYTSGDIFYTGATQTFTPSVFITGLTDNTISINTSLIPQTSMTLDCVSSGAIFVTGGHTGAATGVLSSNLYITGRVSGSVITGVLNGIQTIESNCYIYSSGTLDIQLTGLTTIVSGLRISAQDTATAATFAHPLNNNSSLTAVSTTYTGYAEYYYPIIISGDAITGVSASALTQVGNISGQAGTYGGYIKSTGMTNFSMPNVTGWHTQTEFDLPNVTGFNMSGVTFLGGLGTYNRGIRQQARTWQGFWLKLGSTLTGALDFSNLTDIHYYSNNGYAGYGYFVANPMLIQATGVTSIDMSSIVTGVYKPAWQDIDSVTASQTATTVFICDALTGLTFGASGTTKRLIMNFAASGSPLNEASVDSILETFASLDGTNGTSTYSGLTITLNGLCAAPSSAGSGYRDTLTGAGRDCTVLINS
jgi:hypothetical protein